MRSIGHVIFWQSHYPAPKTLPDFRLKDKLLHITAYALLGVLFCRALIADRGVKSRSIAIWGAVLFTTLYGISDELHQFFIPSRTADVMDVLADGVGAVLGSLAYACFIKNKHPKSTA